MKKPSLWKHMVLAGSLIGLCSFSLSLQAAPRGGIVRIVSVGEPQVLNPVFDNSPAAQEFYNLIFSGLIRENHLTGLEPDLVETVPTPANGMVKMLPSGEMSVTYRLRNNLKWQDGQPLTADDIQFTWQVHTDPAIKYPPTPGYEQIRLVEIVDPQTAVVHFHRAYGDYYRLFRQVLPRHSFRSPYWKFAADHPYNRHPVGSGPFALKDWVKGESALLEANPLYHRARPHLDQLRFRFEADGFRGIKEALNWAQDAEIMRGMSLASYDYLKNQPDLDLHVVANGQIEEMLFNLQDPLMADRRIRRALAFATDRKAISDLLLGLTEPAYSDQLRDSWKYNPATERFYSPDAQQARHNLAQAGWQGDSGIRQRNGQALDVELVIAQGNKSHQVVARYLQESWKQIGVNLKVKTVSPEVLRELVPKGEYQLALATLTQHPGESSFKRWHSTQLPPQGMNYARFSDYQVDEITRELQQTVNFSRQKALYHQLGTLLAEELPALPLYYGSTLEANRKMVHNFSPSAAMGSTWNSHSWWLE
ncbi:MAG: peptide ABC transporter substrate-binding protein [Candidatus Sericytochromatia bacterium]